MSSGFVIQNSPDPVWNYPTSSLVSAQSDMYLWTQAPIVGIGHIDITITEKIFGRYSKVSWLAVILH